MVRLRTILVASMIAIPTLLQASDFNWWGAYKQGYYFVTELPDSGDSKSYSTFQADNGNTFLGISSVGANVKGDKYSGAIELRVGNPNKSGSKVVLNQAWGAVDLTEKLGLTIGIAGTPFCVNAAFQGYAGEVDQFAFGGRRAHNDNVMIYQLNINNPGPVSGKFALVHNEGDIKSIKYTSGKGDSAIEKHKVFGNVPQMQASASYKSSMINANIMGAFQTFKVKYKTDSTVSYSKAADVDVPSWAFGFDVGVKIGFINLLGGFAAGRNTENMGVPTSTDVSQPYYEDDAAIQVTPGCVGNLVKGDLKSTAMWGAPFSVTFNFTKTASVTAGYGLCDIKQDWDKGVEVKQSTVFGNAKLKLACFTFIPEVGYIDYDDYNDAANQFYYGLFTQVDL